MKAKLLHTILIAIVFLLGTSCTQAKTKVVKSDTIKKNRVATVASPKPDSVWHQSTQQAVVKVKTDSMGVVNNTVTLPKSYLAQTDTAHYPVVYLLHGFGDDHTEWAKKADLKAAADKYAVIIVCPDGKTSWYFDSPINSKMRYETYISKDLVQFIDKHYRTRATRAGRAITGLSMGGHGALWNAFRHPDVFGSCGSMSGGVDITRFPDRWNIQQSLGRYANNKQVWTEHSVINLVPTLKPGMLNIIIDDGRQDFFYDVNMALHQALTKAGISHDFSIRPGQHSWKYWVASLPQHLDFFKKAFDGKPIVCKTNIENDAKPQGPAKKSPKKKKNRRLKK